VKDVKVITIVFNSKQRTMKANELRIGNYVRSIGIDYIVWKIDALGNIQGVEGGTTFNLDKTTHPNPETFLNQRRWEDEAYQTAPKQNRAPLNPLAVNVALNGSPDTLKKLLDLGWTIEELKAFVK